MANVSCFWDIQITPPGCFERPCAGYFSSTTCNGDALCQWDTLANKCKIAACGTLTTACQCTGALLGTCFWDNGTSTCQDKRFAGCGNMDIVFLLDGSVATLEPSGRERMALAGIVESLRQWTLYAPLTGTLPGPATSALAGFRVGVLKMGDPTNMCPTANCRITGLTGQ